MSSYPTSPSASATAGTTLAPESERRFGGLRRLHGPHTNQLLNEAHVAVVGLGGVGSWTAEALARCGVGRLTLIDLDHVAASNVNRQIHALTPTLGQAKIEAMAERIQQIHPECCTTLIDDFLTPENAALVLPPDAVVVDATDQVSAKLAMVLLTRERRQFLIVCGAAGGKTLPTSLRVGDLSQVTHDALLNRLRHQLRRHHGYPKGGSTAGKARKRVPRMGVHSLWFDQPTLPPLDDSGCVVEDTPQGLSCAGYGSIVTVTATMGLAAAHEALAVILPGPTE